MRSTTCCSSTPPRRSSCASLERSLRIADEIVRFRIVKLKPGTPEAPDMKSGAAPVRHAEPEPTAETEVEAVVEAEAAAVEVAEPAQAG